MTRPWIELRDLLLHVSLNAGETMYSFLCLTGCTTLGRCTALFLRCQFKINAARSLIYRARAIILTTPGLVITTLLHIWLTVMKVKWITHGDTISTLWPDIFQITCPSLLSFNFETIIAIIIIVDGRRIRLIVHMRDGWDRILDGDDPFFLPHQHTIIRHDWQTGRLWLLIIDLDCAVLS